MFQIFGCRAMNNTKHMIELDLVGSALYFTGNIFTLLNLNNLDEFLGECPIQI